ncbi:methylenetetrahydrofolate--tRNA-(uracil(54)-C(5))-methyltransferase (FADH(2)-oxidizing) TrmFO [Lutispora sp.]|uniref:methylenetetrahydrofolate--tRNA-(uracil(54)- C(5))-methyltransferase (FADH(2)-oxidizing) TrmFO n=1 Tax=Lutispora sp. TaxID=2828727 RepID=UPI002B2056E1|nr:methylenetetrahydrofolate--tRNA-(uracil(54)-C(5))-methyltransferase (FADH(2)-oxidizing) TrmFO [Lutispora sp.]MEA4960615.1 methylenetetrahydrofolate--tRNA-(uracil(54)-C(5))-methyltransferase (FADH(2)-oxidizing) TrmFO [Lutispora sp.]
MLTKVKVIGGGLAGCEAAWQIANSGIKVQLYEMRPKKMTPAHHTGIFAELVCSNSLRSNQLENAVGLLKEELRMLKSLIIESADKNMVPAGGALAVDRDKFSIYINDKIKSHPNIEIINEEVTFISEDEYTIIATGPLTSDNLSKSIREYLGEDYLYFYDAAAPIVAYDSIDMDIAYKASRYGKGEDDYINCPMNKTEYENFYKELIDAETAELKYFEKETVFEGCMPVEVMALRGPMTLLFGPLKPVGLSNPRTGEQPYAVVQLRQDNQEGTLYNMVGFQTHLKWPEQKRVFSLIPGLGNAEFVRYGVMHRNTFINSPRILKNTLQTIRNPKLMFAGQITGVEGYVESTSSGMVAGINMSRIIQGKDAVEFPKTTAHGSLSRYITDRTIKSFQPMNVNFGIFEPLKIKYRNKQEKNREYSKIALEELDNIIKSF